MNQIQHMKSEHNKFDVSKIDRFCLLICSINLGKKMSKNITQNEEKRIVLKGKIAVGNGNLILRIQNW